MPNEKKEITNSTCKIENGRLLVKSSALALLEGISNRTIQHYRSQGIPTIDRYWFDYTEVRKWLKQQEGIDENSSINWKQRQLIADTRLKEAKASKEELDIKKIKGEIITIKKAQEGLILFLNSFRVYYTHLAQDIMSKIEKYIPKQKANSLFMEIRNTIENFVKEYLITLENS